MSNRSRWIVCALVFACAGGAACHGASSSDAPPGSADASSDGPSGGPISSAREAELLDAIDAKFTALYAADPAKEPQALVTFAKSFPEVADARYFDDDVVWTTFINGHIHLVGRNHDDGAVTPTSANKRPAPPGIDLGGFAPRPELLPTGASFVILSALNASWGRTGRDLGVALGAVGYVQKAVEFTPSALEAPGALANVGVLYISTHGSASTYAGGSADAALWTDERAGASVDKYRDERDKGLVATFTTNPTADDAYTERHYAITPAFVAAYLRPPKNLFVYVDACHSASVGGGRHFADKFFEIGAIEYLGWDRSVNFHESDRITRLFFEIVLGQPLTSSPPDPPIRPFPTESVVNTGGVGARTLTAKDGTRLIDLTPSWLGADWIDLAPSIKRLTFDRYDTSLLAVEGLFGFPASSYAADAGADAGPIDLSAITVTVGGASVPIVASTRTTLTVKLPDEGAGSAGDVVVNARGIHSNAVPLTDWHAKFHFVGHGAGVAAICTYTLDWTLHLRGDIHKFALAPRDTSLFNFDGPIVPAPNASLTYVMSGVGTTSGHSYVCAGSGLPKFSTSPGPDDTAFYFGAQISVVTGAELIPYLRVGGEVTHLKGTYSEETYPTDAIDAYTYPIPWPAKVVLGDDASIAAGSSGIPSAMLTWGAAPAGSPPTVHTAQ